VSTLRSTRSAARRSEIPSDLAASEKVQKSSMLDGATTRPYQRTWVAHFEIDRSAEPSTLTPMAKRKKMPTDLNQRAKAIVDFATSDEPGEEKDEARARGGKKGAKSRAEKLSPDRRSEIARSAARSRWSKSDEPASTD
jgi:hypothetical protein